MNAPLPREVAEFASSLTLKDRIDQKIFDALYARSLVYNTCGEDPAVDRLSIDLELPDLK